MCRSCALPGAAGVYLAPQSKPEPAFTVLQSALCSALDGRHCAYTDGFHLRAAVGWYYLQQAETSCPPHEKRRKIDDVQPLIEAVWQYCQAGQWREAYILMEQEEIFDDLKRWGSNTILLGLYQLLLPLDNWHPKRLQEADIYNSLGRLYYALGNRKRAQGYYEKALSKYIEIGNDVGKGTALNNLGWVHDAIGWKEKALEFYRQALSRREEV